MNDLAQSRTASILDIILGIWIAISPIWISVSGAALVTLFIVAGILIVLGFAQMATENSTPSWIMTLAAIWLFISAFSYGLQHSAVVNLAISGIVAFVLSVWDTAEISHYHDQHTAGA